MKLYKKMHLEKWNEAGLRRGIELPLQFGSERPPIPAALSPGLILSTKRFCTKPLPFRNIKEIDSTRKKYEKQTCARFKAL